MKRVMMSRYPFSALTFRGNDIQCPLDVSIRNWKKGLANRWDGNIPAEVEFNTTKIGELLKWIKSLDVEYCRHPVFKNRFYFPSLGKATWIKMKWYEDCVGVAYDG